MIVCERKDLANYKGLDSRLDEAIDWILTDEWRSLPEGQKLVQGREIWTRRSRMRPILIMWIFI